MASIENLRKQAKQIIRWHREGHYPVAPIIRLYLPRFSECSDSEILESRLLLTEAQELVARRAGFESWSAIAEGRHTMEPKVTEKARITGAEPQLFVTNLTASFDYYRELGFEQVFAYGEPPFYAQIQRDGVPLNLRLTPTHPLDRSDEDLLAVTLLVDDVKQLYLEFSAAGVEFHQPLKTEPWGSRTFILKDPDGNLILFVGSG